MWRGGLLVALLALHLGAAATALAAQARSGQALVAAVQQWMRSGGNLSVEVSSLSLNGTTFVTAPEPLPAGHLQLLGSPPGARLDLAMKSQLIPLLDSTATLVTLQDLVLINLCSAGVSWNPQTQNFAFIASNQFLLPVSDSQASLTRRNVTLYVSPYTLRAMTLWQVLTHIPFPDLQNIVMKSPNKQAPATHSNVSRVTPHSLTLEYMLMAGGEDWQITYQSTNNPHDPLRLQSLGGTLMEHRMCNGPAGNGTLVSDETMRRYQHMYAIWVVDNSSLLARALIELTQYNLNNPRFDGIPTLLFATNATVPPNVSPSVSRNLLLRGPFNHHPATAISGVTLSLGRRRDWLTLKGNATLYIAHLGLDGLHKANLPGSSALSLSSTLQLPNIARGEDWSNSAPRIRLHNVTMHVSCSDFLALLAAVLRGPGWKTGAGSTRGLMEGIDTLTVAPDSPLNMHSLNLSEYLGWGVHATDLVLVPESYLEDETELPDAPFVFGIRQSGGYELSHKTRILVALLPSVGVLFIVLACVSFVALRRRGIVCSSQTSDDAMNTRCCSLLAQRREHLGDKPSDILPVPALLEGDCASSRVSGAHEIWEPPSQNQANAQAAAADGTEPLHSHRHAVSRLELPAASVGSGESEVEDRRQQRLLEDEVRKEVDAKAVELRRVDADKLTLERVIGRGGHGIVFQGAWRGLRVAVKTVVFADVARSEAQLHPRQCAVNEAAVCISVSHPNVVSTFHFDIKRMQALDVNSDSGDPLAQGLQVEGASHVAADWKLFLIQEWCDSSLGQALRLGLLHHPDIQHAPKLELVLQVLLQCAQGVEYLHSKHIIHGDLKPENVMLKVDTTSPIGATAKITDFGLSRPLGPDATHVSNQKSGTPFYCAPEVALEARTTKASDVFSMGVLMWETFARISPWVKTDGAVGCNPAFVSTLAHGSPRPLVELVRRCLQPAPKARPTMSDVVEELVCMLDAWHLGFNGLEILTHEEMQ